MAREKFGRAGIDLPVPGTQETFNTAIEVENLKKLSTQLDNNQVRVSELYSRSYRAHSSSGESLASLGSVKSGWKITGWWWDCRGYNAILRVNIERTGANITVGATGNIGNQVVVTTQPRFRPVSAVGATTNAAGPAIGGYFAANGDLNITWTMPSQGIKKGQGYSLSAVYLMNSPGLA